MMFDYFYIIFLTILIFFVNLILIKKNLLLNNIGKNHQNFTYINQVPLSGGIILMIFFLYFITDYILLYFVLSLFILGLLADLNFLNSPLKRFFFQIFLIVILIIYHEIKIVDIRVEALNEILKNDLFNIFFCSMCFLVLINGSNFIDGNNGLSIGYFLINFLFVYKILNLNFVGFLNIEYLIIILCILLIFNLFNKMYLGDSGIYILSTISGLILIKIYNENSFISPYYIVNLLWYPAFEILFSIIRKIKSKFSPVDPDTLHLHQLIFFYFTKKFKFKKNILNSMTGLSINFYMIIPITFASFYSEKSNIQILILLINIANYLLFYLYFYKNKLNANNYLK